MKISLTSKVNRKYRRRAAFIVFGFLLFILVPFFVPQEKVNAGTKIGSAVNNGEAKVYLESATYYEENHLLEVAVLGQGNDLSNRALDLSAVATNEKNKKYPVKQEKINDNYRVFFITDVPTSYTQIKLTLTDEKKSSDMFDATLDPLFITPKNSQTQDKFVAQTTKAYQKKYLDGLIAIQEDHLAAIDKEIKKLNDQIDKLEKSSSDVTADVELMTGAEKQKAMDKIKQNTSQINQIKSQIEAKEKEKTEYNEKIERVESAQ